VVSQRVHTRRRFLAASVAAAVPRVGIERAVALLNDATVKGDVASACLFVQRGDTVYQRAFGAVPGPQTPFIIASISKPMTAAGVMILVDRKAIALDHPVRRYIPEFAGGARERVTIRHLLTHTSGLPDMLPDNQELRRRRAPLRDFVAGACRTPLLFAPGSEVRYQSMGILLAAEIAERVTGTRFREFLARELFRSLGMDRTSLGLGGRKVADTALCQDGGDPAWGTNSAYWRDMGHPWGGVHATAADVATFVRAFLHPDGRVLRTSTAQAMVTDQTPGLGASWGLGWNVQPGYFGRGCSPRTFGHYGASGTVAWADPAADLSVALLTTKPLAASKTTLLVPVSERLSS
jgi:CubicO group peptidase (beta-lactamase class C family)